MIHNMCIEDNDLEDEEDGEAADIDNHLEGDPQLVEFGDRRAELLNYFNN